MGQKRPSRIFTDLPGHSQGALLLIGTLLILISALPVFLSGSLEDIASVVFLAVVLWIGVLGGMGPGAAAAIAATAGYSLLRLRDLAEDIGVVAAIGVRSIAFLSVGLGAGYLISRLRALLEGTEQAGIRDLDTGSFSSSYMQQLIALQIEEHLRYGKPFSLLTIRSQHRRTKTTASLLQSQIRASDTVGMSRDGNFHVILAHTAAETSQLVIKRLEIELASAGDSSFTITRLSAPEHLDRLFEIAGSKPESFNSSH